MTANRFRFRVYDINAKTMYSDIDSFTLGEYFHKDCYKYDWCDEDHVLMQSTGLLDRNGKEIFEGDLLQISYKDGRISMVGQVKFGDHQTSTDYYASSAFGWYVEDVRGGYDSEYSIVQTFGDFQEIVGNIYENGDLIK